MRVLREVRSNSIWDYRIRRYALYFWRAPQTGAEPFACNLPESGTSVGRGMRLTWSIEWCSGDRPP